LSTFAVSISDRLKNRAVLMLLLAAVLVAVYWPVFEAEFLSFDDGSHIVENPIVVSPSGATALGYWLQPYNAIYAPLTHMSWGLVGMLSRYATHVPGQDHGELDARWFHGFNLLLHVACTWAAFDVLWLWVRRPWAAFGGALLFALHPLAVEPVAWCSETKGLQSAFWSLICLGQYFRGVPSGWPRSTDGPVRRRRLHLISAWGAYVLALLSKPSAMVVLPMILLGHYAWAGRQWRTLFVWLMCTAIPTMGVISITRHEQRAALDVNSIAPSDRVWVAMDAIGFYLSKLLWPFQLAPDYGRSPRALAEDWGWMWILAPICLGMVLLLYVRGRSIWLVALGWFLMAPLPVLGFIPFLFQEISTVADRYVYLGLLGPALAVAWGLVQAQSKLQVAVAGSVLLALALLTQRQARVWHDDTSLGEHTLQVNPDSTVGCGMLAFALERSGQRQEALSWRRQAAAVEPVRPASLYYLAQAEGGVGDWQASEDALRRALNVLPYYPAAQSMLAQVLILQGRAEEARQVWSDLMASGRARPEHRVAFAEHLAKSNRVEEAMAVCREGLAVEPDSKLLLQALDFFSKAQAPGR
jgi:tetratricopeptide (TPR) repeat protein